MKSSINYHLHTAFSDGIKSVEELVKSLKNNGITSFSITDHDSVGGNEKGKEYADKYGIHYVNGIELICNMTGEANFDARYTAHILGLGIDVDIMKKELENAKNRKEEMLNTLVDLLIENGYKIDRENICDSSDTIARKYILAELVENGYATNRTEAFTKILNTGVFKPYSRNKMSIKEGIQAIHNAGGLAIIAHPFKIKMERSRDLSYQEAASLLEIYAKEDYGFDGIEVYYGHYNARQIEFLLNIAADYNWLKSIGTDFHFFNANPMYRIQKQVFDVENIIPDESIRTKFKD